MTNFGGIVYFIFKETDDDESDSELNEEELPSATEQTEATPTTDADKIPNTASTTEEIANSTDVAIVEAMERAEDVFDFQVPCQRKQHCTCRIWDGKPCIQQFSNAEQNEVRK